MTRDLRGYENTFLLHTVQPGERPRVLYWYRSAPGVRVGRPPLDEDAIRTIEERYPDIEFDWPHIFETGMMIPPEVEKRPERLRRKAPRRDQELPAEPIEGVVPAEEPAIEPSPPPDELPAAPTVPAPPVAVPLEPHQVLLEDLVGREIRARLLSRHAEVMAKIEQSANEGARAGWRSRAAALDPDRWLTTDEILRGIERAGELFDELRREIDANA